MIVDFEGRKRELDLAHVRFQHALVIQSYTGQSIDDWKSALELQVEERDGQTEALNFPPEWLKAVGALYWLWLAQNDEKTAIADLDFDFAAFYIAFVEGLAQEVIAAREQEKADDPGPKPARSPKAAPASRARSTRTATTRTPRAPSKGGPSTAP